MNRRIFMFFTLLFFIVVSSHAPQVYAQSFWPDEGFAESRDSAASGDVNAAAHVVNVNTNNYSDLVRRILGPIPGVTTNMPLTSTVAKQMLAQSAMYNLTSYIATLYVSPPASTYAFVRDMGQTLGFIPKTAYAQGIGFSGLSALLPIWKMFRNMAYFLLAIIMVVVGFMVMFRKKIDPKTVVTVQNALPGIVIALLLITFSYAIVGIMIDLMYVFLVLIIQLLNSSAPGVFNSSVLSEYTTSGFGAVMNGLWGGFGFTNGGYMGLLSFLGINPTDPSQFIAYLLGGEIVSGILLVILSLAYLFAAIRIFFMLLSAYVQIILALLTSPLQLLMVAIPGSKAFESWIKNLFTNIIVFPLTAILLMVGIILTKSTTQLWTPPLLGFGSKGITSVLALGIALSIPSIIGSIKEALKTKPMMAMGGGAMGIVGTATQMGVQYYMGKKQLQDQMRGMQKWMDASKNEMPPTPGSKG